MAPTPAWGRSPVPRPDVTAEYTADPGINHPDLPLHLLLSSRVTRVAPASRAPWESRGPEAHRSVPPQGRMTVMLSQLLGCLFLNLNEVTGLQNWTQINHCKVHSRWWVVHSQCGTSIGSV